MACDKPTGDCTNVSPCGSGGCGSCSGGCDDGPILPKCQDVSLTPGVFLNATVTVNAQGCIASVTAGEPELYTPDECCGTSSGGGGGTGPRGPKGDPGAAATVDVVTTIDQSGTSWKVENVGTTSAAVFKFTAPASTGGGGGGAGGATGEVGGLEVIDGVVIALPGAIVSDVEIVEAGQNTALFEFVEVPTSTVGGQKVSLNLDALVAKIDNKDNALQAEIDALEGVVAALSNRVTVLENKVAALQASSTPPGYGYVNGVLFNSTANPVVFSVSGLCLNTDVAVAPNSTGFAPALPPGQCNSSIHFIKVNGIAVGVYDPYNEIISSGA